MTITVTPNAVAEVQKFMEEQGAADTAGLRVAVLPGGCSGFQYGLNIEDEAQGDDEVFDLNGLRLFVDPFSGQYLDGVEIDYVTTMMGSGFTFKNPNASGGAPAAMNAAIAATSTRARLPSALKGGGVTMLGDDASSGTPVSTPRNSRNGLPTAIHPPSSLSSRRLRSCRLPRFFITAIA